MTPEQFSHIQQRLEALRDRALSRRLCEQDVWSVLQETSGMLDRIGDGAGSTTLRIIYSLVDSVWHSVRAVDAMREAGA